ncbi:ABC transporter ATP-binding protein [Cellvibrio fibrivorans]|uniref:Lipopolysaccharide transport system ATP-binding protein n=1 Tax=Cellvibrio fibrivorans TaxID=126350 RepID=A0ABU1UU37_9GAMM|nr:ABC transporter ATP-binding protein [Cellvibrio fibrivorans]MDR7088697.1 lipopolysaccharide transport system ATP-binding protein [Cellvibrio fibrivorans]
MSSDISIKVENIGKDYQIYENPADRLKQFLYPGIQNLFRLQTKQYYKSFRALHGVSFVVRKGETVGIVGRNGAGKSTLLQIICGTLFPTRGNVEINGRIAALLELGAGFNVDYTGLENVYLNAALMGISREEINNKLDDILQFADIGEFIHQPIKTYSSGMVVRLAFSVAINVNPDILIVDEALAVGDELFQRKCFSKIEEIKARGATILFVSHSGATVVGLCDRAILIDGGELLLSGEPKKIVGLYQKLMFSTGVAREEIRANILRDLETLDAGAAKPANNKACDDINLTAKTIAIRESYDPGLVSTSLVEYASNGASITDPHIVLDNVGRVNNLVIGGRYTYRFNVSFERAFASVRFGMLIKTVSGFELGGATTAKDMLSTVRFVNAGDSYSVSFDFECALAPGVYFLNAGVSGEVAGVMSYLHRLVDAVSFRVLPESASIMTGMVDFKIRPTLVFNQGAK